MSSLQVAHYPSYFRVVSNKDTEVNTFLCRCYPYSCRGTCYQSEPLHLRIRGQTVSAYRFYRYQIRNSKDPMAMCDGVTSGLVRQHRINALHKGGCDFGHYHDSLYLAARLAVEFRLTNSTTQMEILKDIYRCDCSFDRLYSGALNTPSFRKDFGTRVLSIRVLKYFLRVASTRGMTFYHRGSFLPMPEIPLRSGVFPLAAVSQASGGRVVCSMLKKYGAPLLDPCTESDSESDSGPE